jgi:hypothetical protein
VLYFTTKKDLRTIEKVFQLEQEYLTSYWLMLAYVQEKADGKTATLEEC